MNRLILSICMPVYNGSDRLAQALEGIASQFDDWDVKGSVEIVISDNASTDNTVDIVKAFQERFDNVRYVRNDENLGFDLNFLNTIEESSGDYCWAFNADTTLKDGAIAHLLERLSGGCDVYLISELDATDQKIYDGNGLLDTYGLLGGKLNRVILKREKIPSSEPYIGNLWLHYSLALEMIATGRIGVLKELTVPDNAKLSKWATKNGQGFVALVNLKKMISHCKEMGYNPRLIRSIERGLTFSSPKALASAKLYGLKCNYENFVSLFQFPLLFPLLLIMFVTPSFVFKWLKSIKDMTTSGLVTKS